MNDAELARFAECVRELQGVIAALPVEVRDALRANAGAWYGTPKEHRFAMLHIDLPGYAAKLPDAVRVQAVESRRLWDAVPQAQQHLICWLASFPAAAALSVFGDALDGVSPEIKP